MSRYKKQAVLYVLNLDNLGKAAVAPDSSGDCVNSAYGVFGTNYNSQTWNSRGDAVFQEFAIGTAHIHGSPVSAVDQSGTTRIYVWPEMGLLEAFTWRNGMFDSANPVVNMSVTPTQMWPTQVMDHHPMPGGALSVSALPDHSEVIVWATYPKFDAFNPPQQQAVPGTLYAFDGEDATQVIWSSDIGEYAKFTPPTIANGHVYVATFDGKLQVYGLYKQTGPPPLAISEVIELLQLPLRPPPASLATSGLIELLQLPLR